MALDILPVVDSPSRPAPTESRWVASPYLHVGDDRIHNPHTDLTLEEGQPGYRELRAAVERGVDPALEPSETLQALRKAGWIVEQDHDLDRRYRLKYVSLEAHTVCNQACYFCPVSMDPREDYFMPTETYERLVREVADLGEPLEAVFMINYNEPTLDKRFVDQVGTLKAAGLPPATLTNGSGLTPDRADALVEMGGLRYLCINLSTMDSARYAKERGKDQLSLVMRNLDYLKDKPVAERMDIIVLGTGDDNHERDYETISGHFEGSRFTVNSFRINDRAGYLQIGKGAKGQGQLCGCDNMGSRPIQHLHITPRAEAVLCCQDYDERWVVGDLEQQSLKEVLEGPEFAQARRWVYGLDEAPEGFICHGCEYALKR